MNDPSTRSPVAGVAAATPPAEAAAGDPAAPPAPAPPAPTPPVPEPPVPEPPAPPAPEPPAPGPEAVAVPGPSAPAPLSDPAPAPQSDPAPAPPADPAPVPPEWLRLAEAAVFAAAAPVAPRTLAALLPEGADVAAVLAALRASTAGRGVELVEVAGGVQFRTAPDLAPALRKIVEIPRRLPRAAMETLAIVAWHQPVTRAEIEEIRGASLSQSTLDALLEADLVAPRGRRDTPGRPTLWGTTPAFLTRFGLRDLRELPRREELLTESTVLPAESAPASADEPGGDEARDEAPDEAADDPAAPSPERPDPLA